MCPYCRSHFDMIAAGDELSAAGADLGNNLRAYCDSSCPKVNVGGGILMPFRAFCGMALCCGPFSIPCVIYARVCEHLHDKRRQQHEAGGAPTQPLIASQPSTSTQDVEESSNSCKDTLYDASVKCIGCCQGCCY